MKTTKHISLSRTKVTSTLLRLTMVLCITVVSACEDFLHTKAPSTQVSSSEVFETDATAMAAVLGMYERIMGNFFYAFNGQLTLCAGLSSDELLNVTGNPILQEFFSNSINPSNDQLRRYFWNAGYSTIYQANAVIEGLAKSKGVTPETKSQLEGEARVMRAFTHFYLVNLFGEVPHVTTTDYRQNSTASRDAITKVYDGIVNDLTISQLLLADNYLTTGRIRPNKAVATALLARVYLYHREWQKAESEATKVITNSSYSLLSNLNNVFLANSAESIWQMIPVSSGSNTAEGNRFAYTSGIPAYAEMSPSLVSSFEPGDGRRTAWITQYTLSGHLYSNPFKYKVRSATTITEYYTVFRLAEQYLIRAEARTMQNKLTEAISDVDAIRSRAAIPLIQITNPSISKDNLLLAIEQERKIELFCEWGHRWLDLKRTGRVEIVMQANKGANWKSYGILYPIPLTEILNNSKFTQNPGY